MHRTRFPFGFTISTLMLASLGMAPNASLSSRAGAPSRASHLPDSLPPSVEVREGILYFGGNRMAGNLVLTASDSGLVVNGFRVQWVRKPRGYLSIPSNDVMFPSGMYEGAASIAESARKKSLPRDKTLRLIRDHFNSYIRFVKWTEIHGDTILMQFRDRRGPSTWVLYDPIDPERLRVSRKWGWQHQLDLMKEHLDRGGMVLVPGTNLPANTAASTDEAIQRLQSGHASSRDKKSLQQIRNLDELKHPLPLRPVTTRLYPAGPAPQSVVVGDGVIYVGGHRQSGPLLLSTSDSGLIVNGLRNIPTTSPFPHDPMSHGDSIRASLNDQARRIAEDGRRKGWTNGEILRSVRKVFFRESMVTSIEIRGHWVVVGYVDLPRVAWLELEALREPVTRQRDQEWARSYELLRVKGHLEGGGVVLYTRRGVVYLSSQKSPEIDRLIQRLQAGDITPNDERTLMFSVQHEPYEELRNPIPMEELRRP